MFRGVALARRRQIRQCVEAPLAGQLPVAPRRIRLRVETHTGKSTCPCHPKNRCSSADRVARRSKRRSRRPSHPQPYSLFPVPCSLFPVPCSLFPVPSSLFPDPFSLFPVPSSLLPLPSSLLPLHEPRITNHASRARTLHYYYLPGDRLNCERTPIRRGSCQFSVVSGQLRRREVGLDPPVSVPACSL